MLRTALALAFSPTAWPPIPSATINTCPCVCQTPSSAAGWAAQASWLWLLLTPTSVRLAYRIFTGGPPRESWEPGRRLPPSLYRHTRRRGDTFRRGPGQADLTG